MAKQPNVLLVTTDHWPASLLGIAGHPAIQTPTLDELSRAGVRFTNAYSECPVCIPARRTLMTGTTPRTHGDRVFKVTEPMPAVPTLAQSFRDAGYQAYAVGKLHVYPQRDRIGFDDVILSEEGRSTLGATDDYEIWLGENGAVGQQFGHGMSNNLYVHRAWHLSDDAHVTNWATREMCRMIRRRDPTRPGFWFLSYVHPHPPLAPLQYYLDVYRDIDPPPPVMGRWAADTDALPYALQAIRHSRGGNTPEMVASIKRAFYALCTQIDHQLRLVIGTLREENLLNDTIICFTSDHGDMLGTHDLWAKRLFYEDSANVPMILLGTAGDTRVPAGTVDDRIVGWQDVMPTLLDLAGIPVPASVDGRPMHGPDHRESLYGECGDDDTASRMVRESRYKLIYYPTGNVVQLFDTVTDPNETQNLSGSPEYFDAELRLKKRLIDELYGDDLAFVENGELIGRPAKRHVPRGDRGLAGQRGIHWPPPPPDTSGKPVGAPG